MGISVEKTKAHQLLQVTGGPFFGHRCRIDPLSDQSLTVVDLDARQVIKTKHPATGQLPDHCRNADIRIIEKLLPEASSVFGLQTEIQFPQQHTAAFPGQSHPVATTAPAGVALHRCRHLLHDLQIETEEALEPGTLKFQHHIPATAQLCAMHLGQAGGAERNRIDLHHLLAAGTQLSLQQCLSLGEGERRNPILQLR